MFVRQGNYLLVVFLITLFVVLHDSAHAQTTCSNKLLAEMVDKITESYGLQELKPEFSVPKLCKGKPLIIQKNAQGLVDHVGIKLFDRDLVHRYPTFVYHFIERYFLELLLLPSENEIYTKLRMEKVKISSDIYSLHSFKKDLQRIISDFSKDYSLYIMCNIDKAVACYQNSLRNDPTCNETRYNYALSLFQLKKNQQNQDNQEQQQDDKGQDEKEEKQQQQQPQEQEKKDEQQPQPQQDQMSRENAEQMLNAAMQDEKATQEKIQKAQQQRQQKQLQKQW